MTKTLLLILFAIGCCLTLSAQPVAAFTANRVTGCSPLVVAFTNQSTGASGAATYHWDLGNGNQVVATNPQAIYTTPGTYTITLTVQDGTQSSSTTGTVTVDQPPAVNFSAATLKECAPTPIDFTSHSTAGSSAITAYLWDFGDGSTTTTGSPTATHAYQTPGMDGVSLTVTDADGCASTKTVPDMVTILPTLTAAFTTGTPVLCAATDPVTFTNTSTGPGTLSYQWAFGDGGSSVAADPTYSYSAKGVYTVTLTVTSTAGCTVTDTQPNLLNVANFQTNFNVQGSVCAGTPSTFTDVSSPAPSQRIWTVDGATAGTSSPLSYEFILGGTHTVSLSNVYGTCPQTLTKTITVSAPPVTPPFDMVLSSTCGAPVTVNFLDHTPGAVKWAWIFHYQTADPYPQDTVFGGPAQSNVYGLNGYDDVQLTVTNGAGCSATETQVLNIEPPIVDIVETAGTPEACNQPMTETVASGQMGNLSSWTWVFSDGTTSTEVSPTHTFTLPGNYTTVLDWTDKNGCTGVSNTLFTTVSAPLSYDFEASSTTVCEGQAVTFSGPLPYNGSEVFTTWYFGDGAENFSINGALHIYSTPGVYSVTLNIANVGCTGSVTKTNYITVLPAPTISFTGGATCDSPRAAVTFNVVAGNGATGIAWDFNDGTTLNTAANITTLEHTFGWDQLFSVKATATNGTCSVTASSGVVVELKPLNFHLGVNATAICPATFLSDTLHQTFPPGSTNDYYEFNNVQWYYGDGTPFLGPQNWVNFVYSTYTSELSGFQPGESGLYAVTTNGAGCKDTSNTAPLSIGGTTAAFTIIQDDECYQQPVILQDASLSVPGSPITAWLWNFGDGTTSTQSGTVSHLYASPGNYTVTLTVTDALQCASGSDPGVTGTVTVNGPQAAFSSEGGNVLPLGSTVVFDNLSNTNGAGSVTYSWDFGDGGTATGYSPTHVYATAGTYTVTLTARGAAGGCVSTATLKVEIQPFNSAFAMGSTYVAAGGCPPVLVQFTNTSYNYSSLLWNFGDGETVANVADPSHVYAQPGTYYVTLTVVNGAGQTLVTEDSVMVRAPSAALSASRMAMCVGQADTLSGTVDKEVTGYTWDFGDGTVVSSGAAGGSGGSGGIADADSTMTHIYTVAGTYTAKLVVTDTTGCMAAASPTVTVDVHAPPVAYVTPPAATMCLNGQVTLTANGGVGYSWSPATGLSAVDVAAPVATPGASTVYTVTVADAIGCTSTQSIAVSVVQPETVSVSPDSAAICPGKTVELKASGAERYQWIGATAGLSATDIADPVARPGGSGGSGGSGAGADSMTRYVYTVVGGDTTGCFADSVSVVVDLLPEPVVSAGADVTVQAGTPVTLMGGATGDVVSWLWTPATYLSCVDCAQPVCTPREPETYILTATGGNGCATSDTVVVSLLCDESKVRIPDAFTPNGDGHNDRWDILGISEVNHLVIFNRWGEKVFERDHYLPGDVNAGWDGTTGGRECPPGVYVYYAEMQCPTGGAFERKGTVVLVR